MADRTASIPVDLDDIILANPHRRRLQMLGVVGGSMLITLGAATVSVMAGVEIHSANNNNAASTKKGNDEATVLSRGATIPLVVSLPPTASPSLRPSSSPSESMQPSALPSSSPTSSSFPSASPSSTPSTSLEPTRSLLPTHSSAPSSSSNPSLSTSPSAIPSPFPSAFPSSTPTLKPTYLNRFKLRLYWQEGYYWQESREESWFCLACATCDNNIFSSSCALQETCEEGMLLGLIGCEPGKGGQIKPAEFTVKRNLFDKRYNGDMVSIYGADLCMTRKGRDVYLAKCSWSDKYQRWNGFVHDKEFELQPAGRKSDDKCLTQHHHPKRGERIFAEKCETARKTKTSLWTIF